MTERGERNLERLLARLSPALTPQRFSFAPTDEAVLDRATFALIREEEGITAIREDAAGEWARISLGVHSALDAVGLTAAISAALAERGIGANVVAALRHDHIFVPWGRRLDALAALKALSVA